MEKNVGKNDGVIIGVNTVMSGANREVGIDRSFFI